MNEDQKKQASREATRRYREKIKNTPEEYEKKKAKQRERNRLRMEAIKSDPIKYKEYLERERKRGKQKRIEIKKDPIRKAKLNAYQKKYAENNKEKIKNYQSKSYEEWKKRNILRRYNITIDYYNSLCEKQNGLCAICFIKPKKLFIDHCHETGIIRELLCSKCNTAIGLFNENLNNLNSAIEYLNKHKGLKNGIGIDVSISTTKN